MIAKATAILVSDLRLLMRDGFLVVMAVLSAVMVVLIGAAGHFKEALSIAHLAEWMPFFLIMFLITNVGTYGMLFGLIFVEEVETRVRAALMITPVSASALVLLRSALVVAWLIIQPFVFVAVTSRTWEAVSFGAGGWFWLCAALAPLGAFFMILLSSIASNRVEAMAMGKFFSAMTGPAMLIYLMPDGAWYSYLFLLFPTGPCVFAFEAMRAGDFSAALLWGVAGFLYACVLIWAALRRYLRHSYQIAA